MVHSDALSTVVAPFASCHVTPPSGTYKRAATGAGAFRGSLPATYLRSTSTANVAFCANFTSPTVGPNTSRTVRSAFDVLINTTRPYTMSTEGEAAAATGSTAA